MIPDVQPVHDRMDKLVFYLFGPGKHNEHTNQQVVGSSLGLDVRHGELLSEAEQRHLIDQLNTPKVVFDVEGDHVWHVSLSTAGGRDRDLSMVEWGEATRVFMAEMGFDDGSGSPTPWVGIHHGKSAGSDSQPGNDHVHIAVCLVREDGRMADRWMDFRKAQEACRMLEKRFGLVSVDGRTAGAVPGNSRADLEQQEREASPETQRSRLHRKVRAAASLAGDEVEFVDHLRSNGVVVSARFSKGSVGVVGYSAALKPERGMKPKWFGGYQLAKDLSLPKLRRGWVGVDDEVAAWKKRPVGEQGLSGADGKSFDVVVGRIDSTVAAVESLGGADVDVLGAVAKDTAGVLAVMSERVEPQKPGPLAANCQTVASTAQLGASPGGQWLNGVAAMAFVVGGKGAGSDLVRWLLLVAKMQELSRAIQRLHEARNELSRSLQMRVEQQQIGGAAQTMLMASKGFVSGGTVRLAGGGNPRVGRVSGFGGGGGEVLVTWDGTDDESLVSVDRLEVVSRKPKRVKPPKPGRSNQVER